MRLSIFLIFVILALVFFLLAAFQVPAKVSWRDLAYACLVFAYLTSSMLT